MSTVCLTSTVNLEVKLRHKDLFNRKSDLETLNHESKIRHSTDRKESSVEISNLGTVWTEERPFTQ